ncbi:MAG: B12-binding domain-containing radical SAM protein [bacterium]|nr:B12-binding domain-containing radical SAM protein [bacterium]
MKITFIRPNMIQERQADAMEPLAFAVLAHLTPPDIEVALYDDRVEDIDYDDPTDLIAISVETFTAKRAYVIADRFRELGVPVIMGGFHATFMPDEILEHADSVAIGDAEGVWPQIIEDAQKGKLKKRYQKELVSMEGIGYSREIFKGKKYSGILPVQFSRGCKFDCDFCSIDAFYNNNLMQRPIDEVVAEIASLNKKIIFITDDNVFYNKRLAKEFFTALIPLKVQWVCQVSIDVARDPELLRLMQKSGCKAAIIGFESLDEQNLLQMNKKVNTKNDYETAIKKLQDHGIMIFGTFVIGYDNDTANVFENTLDFAERNKFFIGQFNPLMPMPGTRLYTRLEEEGRLLYDKWWLHPDYKWGDTMYMPKGMTPDELKEGCYSMRMKFNSYGSIFKRALEFNTNCGSLKNLGLYLIANFVTKKEISRKMGRTLGE